MEGFGERITILRKEKGLSQRQLAEAIGIQRSVIGEYEREKNQPSYKNLKLLAQYFNVSIDYIVGKTNARERTNEDVPDDVEAKLNQIVDDLNNVQKVAKFGGKTLDIQAKRIIARLLKDIVIMAKLMQNRRE